MNRDMQNVPRQQLVGGLPLQPAEACTELEFFEPRVVIVQPSRMERCVAAARRWFGTTGISADN